MRAYSQDLRERVAEAVQKPGDRIQDVAVRFSVSISFIDKLLRRKRPHGSVAALPHRGGVTARLDAPQLALLTGCLQQTPDATLAELQLALVAAGGVKVPRTTLWEGIQRLDWRRKKKIGTPVSGIPSA